MHLLLLLLLQAPVTTPLPAAQVAPKQAVIETSMGTIVFALLPAKAPNHVAFFTKTAGDGGFAGTTFHRVIKYGLIQGGDPLSKDPAKSAQYGTGGLNLLKREINDEPMTAGAVAAVLVPGQPNSAGTQFFICASDQAALQGQFTVFGRVVEGLEVVQQISAVKADAQGRAAERIVIKSVTIRDTPPPVKDPLVEATAAELAKYRAVLETSKGEIELEFITDKAPETARQFLRLSTAGVYDGTPVHRVVPNFVLQTGALAYRDKPLTPVQNALVRNLQPEFSDVPNVPGIVSMARGEDPASASTSFFICVGECRALDGKYTVFARVVRGMDVVKAIGDVAVDGETPKEKIVLTRIRVARKDGSQVVATGPLRQRLAPGRRAKEADLGQPVARLLFSGLPSVLGLATFLAGAYRSSFAQDFDRTWKFQGGAMKRLTVVAIVVSVLAAGAGAAVAGEVKGPPGTDPNTNRTAAPAHANSECAFSGLNDNIGGQSVSQVQTAADSWKYYGLPKGAPGTLGLCRGN